MFKGITTALITPFRNGAIDDNALNQLVNWQADQGVEAVLACGSTGEAHLLSQEEQKHVIEVCVDAAQGRIKVMAGTGQLTTEDTIKYTNQAKEAGADCALIINPWYIKPSQASLFSHFKSIHDATELPIILYNNPGRTGVEFQIDTVVKLSQLERIIGIKDSTHDMVRLNEIRTNTDSEFLVLCGDDPVFPSALAMGADSIISSASNVAPHLFVELQRAWKLEDRSHFNKVWKTLTPLLKAMNVASNPQPVKFAATLIGDITNESRLPFVPLDSSQCDQIRTAMQLVGAWQEQPSLNVMPA